MNQNKIYVISNEEGVDKYALFLYGAKYQWHIYSAAAEYFGGQVLTDGEKTIMVEFDTYEQAVNFIHEVEKLDEIVNLLGEMKNKN